jgi:hypothetical protein
LDKGGDWSDGRVPDVSSSFRVGAGADEHGEGRPDSDRLTPPLVFVCRCTRFAQAFFLITRIVPVRCYRLFKIFNMENV